MSDYNHNYIFMFLFPFDFFQFYFFYLSDIYLKAEPVEISWKKKFRGAI